MHGNGNSIFERALIRSGSTDDIPLRKWRHGFQAGQDTVLLGLPPNITTSRDTCCFEAFDELILGLVLYLERAFATNAPVEIAWRYKRTGAPPQPRCDLAGGKGHVGWWFFRTERG